MLIKKQGQRVKSRESISKSKRQTPSLNVVSLFSGCGGLDLGFSGNFCFRHLKFDKTHFNITYANDIDPAAAVVHRANSKYFSNTNFVNSDIKNLSGEAVPDFDFLIAGFPCQPFSNAGLRKGIDDERGTLFEECERILKEGLSRTKKPLGFIFENVKGIMSSKMPNGKSIPEEIVARTEKLGFKTNFKLINACDFGAPTSRQRLIIVGLRSDLGYFDFSLMDKIVDDYDLPTQNSNPYELYLGSILSDIPQQVPHKNEHWPLSPSSQLMIEKIGPCADGINALKKFSKKVPIEKISPTIKVGRSWKNIPPDQMPLRFQKIWNNPQKYRAPNFYRRFSLGEINGTIIASGQPENCGITHPFENRRFSIREIARIQSFPDDFIFPYNSFANAYKVIGNAVPPILGWVLAKAIEKQIFNDKL